MTQLHLAVSLFLLCVLLNNAFASPIESCPPGFLKHQRSCYRFSRFAASWTDAKAYCDAMRAQLASVTYYGLQRFLAQHLLHSKTSENYWIGGNDLAVEGDWRWVYDNSRFGYRAFATSAPDNDDQGEHCLAMDSRHSFRWNDQVCSKLNHFICENHLIEDLRRKLI